MVPDNDPRIDVVVTADLMAAPIGTRIAEDDPSWRNYARRLLARIDAAAADSGDSERDVSERMGEKYAEDVLA
jgi:hypothetical protein